MRTTQIKLLVVILALQLLGGWDTSAGADSSSNAPCPGEDIYTCAKQLASVDEITDELYGKFKTVDPLLADSVLAVRSFSRPVVVFHWADMRNIGVPAGETLHTNDQRVKYYLEKQTSNFWDLSHFDMTGKSGEIGNGLYTSMDPFLSSSFGGAESAVVAITLPKGTRFLDIRYSISPLSEATLDELARAGCAAKDLPTVFTDNNPDCFKFVPPLLNSLGVTAVAQKWGWAQLMDCGPMPGVAFMIVDPTPIDKKNGYRIYNANSDPSGDDAKEMRNIGQAVLEGGLPAQTAYAGKMLFPNASDLKFRWGPVTQYNARANYLDWMKNSLYSCGNYPEDALDPKAPGIAPVNPAQREGADLMDRYLVDLTHFNGIDPVKIHVVSSQQISSSDVFPNSVVQTVNGGGQIWFQTIQAWGQAAGLPGPAYSQALQDFFTSFYAKILAYNDHNNWAWAGGDSTNLVQLALSGAQGFLKISPFPSGNDRIARDLMVFVWKSFDQPAVLTPDLMGDLTKLSLDDYSSANGKDLWLGPYREGISRIENCIGKYDNNASQASNDKTCGLDR